MIDRLFFFCLRDYTGIMCDTNNTNAIGLAARIPALFISITLLCPLILNSTGAQLEVPTARQPVIEEYHGVKVIDEYRWLENAADPAVHDWTARQNARTRAWLDKSPIRNALAAELQELYEESSASYSGMTVRGDKVFMLRLRPPAQQPSLLAFSSVTNLNSRVRVVDPNKLDTNGVTAIDWYVPSVDGRRVAVSLSRNGSEDGALHFFDTSNGKELAEEIPRVQYPTGGGSAAWNADGAGVFYTRYPHPGERPEEDLHFFQQVWFHKLGAPVSQDTCELSEGLPRIAEIGLSSSDDGRHILASVANGDGGDFAHWLRSPSGQWRQITKFEDGIKAVAFGRDGMLYILSRQNAPLGKILRLPLDAPALANAALFVKESDAVIQGFASSPTGLFVHDLVGGPSRVRFFDLKGRHKTDVPLPPVSTVGEMDVLNDGQLLFKNVSYTRPFAWLLFNPTTKRTAPTALVGSSPVDFSDVEVIRETARSKDGTRVPMNIIRRKGVKLDGNNPTVLYGYGGYGVSLVPGFDFTRRLWLDAGGVLAIANLRGGGEFGEAWHKAGNLTLKQNVFDDFIACAEWLINNRYTSNEKLAIEGRSNGGLLVGAALTQRPDLFRAVVSGVGIYDMLRVETDPNGVFNVTEFGSVKDKAQFEALFAYSPYHRVKDGTAYPSVLLTTGENDGRVNPSNSRKMAACLQAATISHRPILLRTSAGAGHGIGSSMRERIAEKADALAFLIGELGADTSRWDK